MARHIVLLRGINVGPNKRVPMPALRDLLGEAGFADVRTYVQSGNVVLSTEEGPDALRRTAERVIEQAFGFHVAVVTRTRDELAQVVERNPLAGVAEDPKRYQVAFLSDEPEPAKVEQLSELAAPSERVVHVGREIYTWHPDGAARSKLWAKLASAGGLGVTVTSRNWTTVTTLLEMAGAG
jgi:uncharacterized protein (DUF1697 family)